MIQRSGKIPDRGARVLAVDTAGPSCSVAVTEADRLLVEINSGMAQTHSRHLMPMVDTALEMAGLALSDLDLFAASKGPGSFTGLRIGMSCVKGMALATGKPAVGISSLEALARQAAIPGWLVCPMLDARRAEVYYSLFESQNKGLACIGNETAAAVDRVLDTVNEQCLFVGSGALAYRGQIEERLGNIAAFPPTDQHTIRGAALARMALKCFETGDASSAAELTPVYLRKSDAELHIGRA
jgi:tRNA threonylcarbamoyladenosine biosynthesis protein TsaB